MTTEKEHDKLELIATRSFQACDELYRVVDFLNKTLKHKRLIFGLTKDSRKGEMTISVYET
ncbi:YpmA family protein [Desulfothermobacter acidiphilus]|uniref:YpmA family protein n=1 Tax=Desulfothermobacter acidiphilus TaxID=1938353 RepID=UPI003F8B59D6